ncbi:MAG: hypothetical protein AB1898_20635 [Acidobacteriota bacterium]
MNEAMIYSCVLAAWLGVWLWDRRRIRCDIARVVAREEDNRRLLEEFSRECEQTFLEFSKKLSRAPRLSFASSPPRLSSGEGAVTRPPASQRMKKDGPGKGPAKSVERIAEILELASAGLKASEIARSLAVPEGEVALILNLQRNRSGSTTLVTGAGSEPAAQR